MALEHGVRDPTMCKRRAFMSVFNAALSFLGKRLDRPHPGIERGHRPRAPAQVLGCLVRGRSPQ